MDEYKLQDIWKKNLREFNDVMRLDSIIIRAMQEAIKQDRAEQLSICDVVGSFVLYRIGAIDNVYWNGKEFTPYKDNIPTYNWDKANEYAKLLNCNFCDK